MEFLLGLAVGYVVVSVCESFFHRTIGHAPARLRALCRKLGWPGRALVRSWYTHQVVHHCLTFRASHVTQFSFQGERRRLDAFLAAKGRRHVIAEDYGLRIGPRVRDHLLFVAPTLPFFAAVCWAGGASFTWGALIPFAVWPMLSQFVHPYTHMDYVRLRATAPPVIRAFAATPCFRAMAMHHWLHHRYGDCNYNLLLGGDLLLGVHRAPSAADLAEMRAIGLRTPPDGLQKLEFEPD